MFNRLEKQDNSYWINSKRSFSKLYVMSAEDIIVCFDFAFAMSFGSEGEHRVHRSGGSHRRKNGEIFINTFQGKLAEFSVYRFLEMHNIKSDYPDIDTYELGKWDNVDTTVRNKKINIKSTKHYGNLLLLETKDWNKGAQYIPNIGSPNGAFYDLFVLIRIKPDSEKIMKSNRMLFLNSISKTKLKSIITNEHWEYDIPGFITSDDLITVISEKYILPKNSFLQGSTKMDAENYYIQTGDMKDTEELINVLATE